jgi:hypothetical protein
MTQNQKGSRWYSPSQASRHRKKAQYTLSDEARERVAEVAESEGVTMSEMVEEMILAWRPSGMT